MYDQGVQKSTVAPFLDRLKIKSPVVSLTSDLDWRLKLSSESTEGEADAPNVSHWYQNIDLKLWKDLVDKHLSSPKTTELVVYGRKVIVSRSDPVSKSAVFTYKELCETALGPADYLKICSTFETILIEGVPVFTTLMKNEGVYIVFGDGRSSYLCNKMHWTLPLLSSSSFFFFFVCFHQQED
jgi:protein AFG1